ncbi:MAG: pyridoxamine 5'-phosphate oxidase family protein [Acidimicrobiales bacterium]|nr:pyridoxamine 5'-phosphate oxidase family protein [Acidimicrobiales bacterium]
MSLHLSSNQVWEEIEKNSFGVLGVVTAKCEPRTVGIVYVVDDHKLYIGAEPNAWKARHIIGNPHVSLTIAIPKRVPLLPWIKVPAATITFSGTAKVLRKDEVGTELLRKLYRHEEGRGEWCAIEVTPQKDFITYGVGISVVQMRFPEKARARAPVAATKSRVNTREHALGG